MTSPRRRLAAAAFAVVVLGAALALVVALQRRDAPLVRPSVVGVTVVALLVAVVAGRGRQHQRSMAFLGASARAVASWRHRERARSLGVAVWVLLAAAWGGFDGYSFSRQQADFPTLSHYVGLVTAEAWGRGLLAFAWVAVGGFIALGWRRGAP